MATKQTIIDALHQWINQRPGLEFGNYGDVSSYRAEMRSIGRDLQHARAMINAIRYARSARILKPLRSRAASNLTASRRPKAR